MTITQYLTAVLCYSIFQANYKKHHGKKPIKICIPVNLKKYFKSKTINNFFSYITLELGEKQIDSFDHLLRFVKEDFEKRLTEEEILKTMSANVKLGNHPFIRMIPLALKKVFVKLSYIEIRKYTTTTFSNIGRVGIIAEYQKYIENFLFLIAPTKAEKIKCSVCSFKNDLTFTFTSCLNDTTVEKIFFTTLLNNNINLYIESNGVYNEKM